MEKHSGCHGQVLELREERERERPVRRATHSDGKQGLQASKKHGCPHQVMSKDSKTAAGMRTESMILTHDLHRGGSATMSTLC